MSEQNSAPETSFYLGFDGGGTKTDCILMDAECQRPRARHRGAIESAARRIRQGLVHSQRCGRRGPRAPSSESRRYSRNLRGNRRRWPGIGREAHRHFPRTRFSRSGGLGHHRSRHHLERCRRRKRRHNPGSRHRLCRIRPRRARPHRSRRRTRPVVQRRRQRVRHRPARAGRGRSRGRKSRPANRAIRKNVEVARLHRMDSRPRLGREKSGRRLPARFSARRRAGRQR